MRHSILALLIVVLATALCLGLLSSPIEATPVLQGQITPTAFVYLPLTAKNLAPRATPTPIFISSISDIAFDPPSPATLHYGEPVEITFNYSTTYPGHFRMWAIGYTNGVVKPYRGSDQYTGPGGGTTTRAITSLVGPPGVVIDTVEFIMRAEDGGRDLVRFSVPVQYTYIP